MDQNPMSEFVRMLVELANRNEELMDGTRKPLERIMAGADLVFAVWQDGEEEFGVGLLPVKGAKLLREGVATQLAPPVRRTDAVKCINREQAIALKQVLGDRDLDA